MERHEIASFVGYIPQEHNVGFASYKVLDVVLMGRAAATSAFSPRTPRRLPHSPRKLFDMVGISYLSESKYTKSAAESDNW
jgi:ABC-type cobalamin/Fe3+-siderophores transport system ATPase subunit